jgi:hypothetical protein
MTLLRALFFVLLGANLLVFAIGRGWLGSLQHGEPERLAAQMEPDKIRILRDPPPVPQAAGVPPAAAAAAATDATAPVATEAAQCLFWPGLARDLAQQLAKAGEAAELQAQVTDETGSESPSFWVHIPAPAGRDDTARLVADLKAKGVDHFVMKEGSRAPGAISLALFKVRSQAYGQAEKLARQGVAGIRIEERGGARASVTLRGGRAALDGLRARLPAELAQARTGPCP